MSRSPSKETSASAAGDVFDQMDLKGKGIVPREEIDTYLREVCDMSGDGILAVWKETWKDGRDVARQDFVKAAEKLKWPVGRDLAKKRLDNGDRPPAFLQVTIVGASNMPQGGALKGPFEFYFAVLVGGKLQRTLTKKDDANPKFEETFGFSVSERPGELSIKLMSCSTLTKDDIVAEACWNQNDVKGFLASPSGTKTTLNLPFFKGGGDQLKSKDGASSVMVTVCLIREGQFQAPPSTNTQDPGLLLFCTVYGAESLPKLEMLGKADSYVSVKYLGQEHRTTLIKYSYEPEWHETFGFQLSQNWLGTVGVVPPKFASQEDVLVASIVDGSRMSGDKKIGLVKISTLEIVSLVKRERRATIKKILIKPEGDHSNLGSSSSSFSLPTSLSFSKSKNLQGEKRGQQAGVLTYMNTARRDPALQTT